MVQQDFEKRGWTLRWNYKSEMNFIKGDMWEDGGKGQMLWVKPRITEGYSVRIVTTDKGYTNEGPKSSVKFNGKCKDMSDFDIVYSLIT